MSDDDRTVLFKLSGKRPDDFTIDRLAKYLTTLSDLVGSPGKVRVKKITPGSVKVELAVQADHYPKFVERVTGARNAATSTAVVRKAVTELETMVGDDHVNAEILAGRAKIFFIRGYSRAAGTPIGPVIQPLSVRGVVNRLEGRDATKHVGITEYGTGQDIRARFSDSDVAAKLQAALWGDDIEVSGVARLMRHPNGVWEIKDFKIEKVQELEPTTAADVIHRLRAALEGSDLEGAAVAGTKRLGG